VRWRTQVENTGPRVLRGDSVPFENGSL